MADITSINTFCSGTPGSIQGTGQVVYIEGVYPSGGASATCPCGGLKKTDIVFVNALATNTTSGYAGFIYDQAGSTFDDTNGIVSIKPENTAPTGTVALSVVIWRV